MSSFLTRDESRLRDRGYDHLLNVTDVVRTEPVQIRQLDTVFNEVVPNTSETPDNAADSVAISGSDDPYSFYVTAGGAAAPSQPF